MDTGLIIFVFVIGAGFGGLLWHIMPLGIKAKELRVIFGTLIFALVTALVSGVSSEPVAWCFVCGTTLYCIGAFITSHVIKRQDARRQKKWQKEVG